jgi:hypothetical protein
MSAARAPDDTFADGNLTDDDLRSEIEMVSELVVAATSSDGPLNQAEVDLLLGVELIDPSRPT